MAVSTARDNLKGQQEADFAAARRVLRFAGEALSELSNGLDAAFSQAVDVLFAVRGRVVVSGMGKSGHVGRKIAATLSSTGTPALFVHPGEASHGDMGALTRADAVLVLSYRGETSELSDLITYAKRYGIPLIGMASNSESTLLKAANVALVLPQAQEACPLGLAPTTSTTMMLALGDALAVALMERRGFSADQYRDLHPGGSLGRALIRVQDLMHTDARMPLVKSDAVMRDVIITMTAAGFGVAGVLDDDGVLAGIITDGDLRRHMEPGLLDRRASEVMTRSPRTIDPSVLAAEALALMNDGKQRMTSFFVVEEGASPKRPIGILHVHDCLRAGLR